MKSKHTALARVKRQTATRGKAGQEESLSRRAWRRFKRHKLGMLGLAVLTIQIVLVVLAPVATSYGPSKVDLHNRFSPPSWLHWMGTDGVGRDVCSRVLYGGRVSLSVGVVSVLISTLIGVVLGGIAGYSGGKADSAIMRFTDVVMSFPSLIIIMILVSLLGPGASNTMIAIGLLGWPAMARLVRGQFLSLRQRDFVVAARCVGVSPAGILFRHLLSNTLGPLVVAITLRVAGAILMEAGLSFLGLGVQPPTPSWGNMLRQAQTTTYLEQLPWVWVFPGVMIVLTVLSVNFLGDGLRDALDPQMRI